MRITRRFGELEDGVGVEADDAAVEGGAREEPKRVRVRGRSGTRNVGPTAGFWHGAGTDLGALLLGEHLLLLLDDLGLVLEDEREGQADEKGGGGDDPDEVSDNLACRLYSAGSLSEPGSYALTGSWGNNIGKRDDTLVEGFLAVKLGAH